jgi:class 3 adenylate cyclase
MRRDGFEPYSFSDGTSQRAPKVRYTHRVSIDLSTLSMTEIVRLQNQLSEELKRRFEKQQALAFSDIVGSTPYFARFGDEAGRRLQQRHFDLLAATLAQKGGRVVDTAGDGAFLCFQTVDAAVNALAELQRCISLENASHPADHQLSVRIGVHYGPVLTDGTLVTGDAVNLCSRVTGSAREGEIRITRDAFQNLSVGFLRLSCMPLGPVELKGIPRPVEVLTFEWRDRKVFPSRVEIVETGQHLELPERDTVTFGRLGPVDGAPGNDIVLSLTDAEQSRAISRWQFELRRGADGYRLRPVSDSPTEVGGQLVAKGAEAPVRPGTIVRVGRVLSLRFYSPATGGFGGASTFVPD